MAGDQVAAAEDSLYAAFREAWLAAPAAMGDNGPYNEPLYVMKDGDGMPDSKGHDPKRPWCRVNVRHVANSGRSINAKRSINVGFLEIQVFYPMLSRTDAGDKVRRLGGYLQETLHAYRGHVNLRDVAYETRPSGTGYKSCAVNAEFDYMLFTGKV